MSSATNFWLGVLLLAVGTYGGYTFWKMAKSRAADHNAQVATASDGVKPVEEFSLTTQTGELFQSKTLQGKVWVGSLFFTLCPRECKLQNQAIAELRKQLPDADLTWISITCDPAMDTPAVLKEYAKRFDADPRTWKFLTGSEEAIRKVAVDSFKVPFARQTHSSRLILVDRDGKVVDRYNVFDAREVKSFKEKVRELTADESDQSSAADESKTSEKETAGAGA